MIDCWARGMMPMEMGVMTDQECEDMLDNISCDESLSLEGEMTMSPSQQNKLVKMYYSSIHHNDDQHFNCSDVILLTLIIMTNSHDLYIY